MQVQTTVSSESDDGLFPLWGKSASSEPSYSCPGVLSKVSILIPQLDVIHATFWDSSRQSNTHEGVQCDRASDLKTNTADGKDER